MSTTPYLDFKELKEGIFAVGFLRIVRDLAKTYHGEFLRNWDFLRIPEVIEGPIYVHSLRFLRSPLKAY